MNAVPEHWIPFRADACARSASRDPIAARCDAARDRRRSLGPQKVRPRTSLLREGIELGQPYFLFEEEVPRAGARVTQAFRRTRARDGRVITWLAAQKRTGRGESSSGLAFDRILPST